MALYDYLGNEIDVGSASVVVNVKDFGAKGNGSAIDSAAIQSALDSVKTLGGVIYFPSGIYLLGTKLIFYSNQILLFEKGAVLKQGAAITSLLMSYCASDVTGYNGTHDCIIYGATFDGNTSYTTNNTLVGTVHAKNIVFENCTFKNAYGIWHNIEINSSYNVKMINCDLEGTRKTGANGELIQIDAINGTDTWPWDDNRGEVDYTVCKYIEIAGCIFHDDTVVPAIGNHSGVTNQHISIHDNIFDGITSSRGAINLQSSTNVRIYNNVFNGCTSGVKNAGSSQWIHDNTFVGVTDVQDGSAVTHNNMINGSYTA